MSSGLFGSDDRVENASVTAPASEEASWFGSKVGEEYIARTAPVLASRATTAPLRLPRASAAAFCICEFRVRVTPPP